MAKKVLKLAFLGHCCLDLFAVVEILYQKKFKLMLGRFSER